MKITQELKVFKMNDYDWVCAESQEQAIAYYKAEYDVEETTEELQEDIIEESMEDKGMWWGFELEEFSTLIKENRKTIFRTMFDNCGDSPLNVWVNWKMAIERNDKSKYPNKAPYLIASTEY